MREGRADDSPNNSACDSSSTVEKGENKQCRVCGDRALGHNFNVVTCESCKAFFRRNALKTKEFRCPFSSTCEVTLVSRRFCQKCRLRKCFEVGMKSEWIWTEEDRIHKRLKTGDVQKVRRRSAVDHGSNESGRHSAETASEPPPVFVTSSQSSVWSLMPPQTAATWDSYKGHSTVGDVALSGHTATAPAVPSLMAKQSGSSFSLAEQMVNILASGVGSAPGVSLAYPPAAPHLFGFTPTGSYASAPFCSAPSNASLPSPRAMPGTSPLLNSVSAFETIPHSASPFRSDSSRFLSILQTAPTDFRFIQQIPTAGHSSCDPASMSDVSSSNECSSSNVNIPRELLVAVLAHLTNTPLGSSSFAKPLEPNQNGASTDVSAVFPQRLAACGRAKEGRVCICPCVCGGRTVVDASANTDDVPMPSVSSSSAALNSLPYYSSIGTTSVSPMANSSPASEQRQPIARTSAIGPSESRANSNACVTSCGDVYGNGFCSVEDASLYNMLDAAITSEFFVGVGSSIGSGNVTPLSRFPGLNAFEQEKLEELAIANEVMKEPLDQQIKKNPTCFMDIINMIDIGMRSVIKMNKRIEAFAKLCQEDQIALLKGGCIEIMILRGLMTYNAEKDAWQGPMSQYIKVEILKEVKEKNLYEEHRRFLQSFKPEWRLNEPIMLILGAIALFNPNRPHVFHRDVIEQEQRMYFKLLQRYLETTFSCCEAEEINGVLLQKIDELHSIHETVAKIFLEVNPKDVEPLLIELFDLKTTSSNSAGGTST